MADQEPVIAPLECLRKEAISRVLDLYVEGVDMTMISYLVELSIGQVNTIIDEYSPFM